MIRSDFPRPWSKRLPISYASAVLSVAVAILAARLLAHLFNAEAIASSLLCAVIFVAWVGGFGPALLAIMLALLAFHHYLAPQNNPFAWTQELTVIVPGEIPRLVLFSLTSGIVAFVISAQRKAAEQLRRSNEGLRAAGEELARVTRLTTLGELAASIAHEVKQPIGATVTNAQAGLRILSAAVIDTNELREILHAIVKDGNRAGEVVSRIRDLTKKAPPRRERFEINETIREVIEFIRGESVKNGVSIRMELANNLPFVWGDRVELQQVVLNLMMNGIEAMQLIEDRSRELVIRSVQDKTQQVRVSVMDLGVGFSAESAERLFTPFFTTKCNGMGMGLSICRSIIEAHNGRLWATANLPHGATFQFTLPVSADTAP